MTTSLLLLILTGCGGGETPPSADTPPAAAKAEPTAEPPAPPPASAGKADAPVGEGDATAGAAVYEQYCKSCHQADGTGMGGMLAANFITDKTRLAKSDAELTKSIKEGVTGKVGTMPPWGAQLSDQEVADVLAHIRATYGE